MAEEAKAEADDFPKFSGRSAPTLFADFVPNLALGPDGKTVRFSLIRVDAPTGIGADLDSGVTVVSQVIMPLQGFMNAVHFFRRRIEVFIKEGAVSQEEHDRICSATDQSMEENASKT